jgi:hypothetical protein
MRLECKISGDRYFLFATEGAERWPVTLPGAASGREGEGLRRDEALRAALLAGFSTREAQRAVETASPNPVARLDSEHEEET